MTYNVYQDDELIKENVKEKEYTVEGLTPNTEYSFSVSEVIGKNESEKSEPITVTTKATEPQPIGDAEIGKNLIIG